MADTYKPTRMCVACRKRAPQAELARFYVDNGVAVRFCAAPHTHKRGRGFYLCGECLASHKQSAKAIARLRTIRDRETSLEAIRESVKNG